MKATIALCVFGLFASASGLSFFNLVMDEFDLFKLQHGKKYATDVEESFRRKIFAENKHKIAKHNQEFYKGHKTYTLAMNSFGDLLPHEFRTVMNGLKGNLTHIRNLRAKNAVTFIEPDEDIMIPDAIDWRTKGAVTGVKDQGMCGSCWAFSTTGSLEGQHFRKAGKLVSLSEQNLVDCSDKFGNDGCQGGLMDQAFAYVKANGGIDTEKSYPYKANNQKCHFNPSDVGATDNGYVDIRSGSEKALKKAVATIGPISVAIDASHDSFQFYSKGVYYEKQCSSSELDHGVLAAGYGTDAEGGDYWLVKNSWGEGWGKAGYIWMARNKENNCGIATAASYPLV